MLGIFSFFVSYRGYRETSVKVPHFKIFFGFLKIKKRMMIYSSCFYFQRAVLVSICLRSSDHGWMVPQNTLRIFEGKRIFLGHKI